MLPAMRAPQELLKIAMSAILVSSCHQSISEVGATSPAAVSPDVDADATSKVGEAEAFVDRHTK